MRQFYFFMNPSPFQTVAIIGVGLIGGSLGLAVKKRYPKSALVGFDRPSVLKRAVERGALNYGAKTLAEAVEHADLVILAAPIKANEQLIMELAGCVRPDATITDVGSVKSGIVAAAAKHFPQGNFIGGHPMAGVELTGIDAAHPLLFENAVYVLTPMHKSQQERVERLSVFLHGLGARVMVLDAATHDSVASAVSHLPQLTAVALMNIAGKLHQDAAKHINLAAGGFRDLTRIASSKFDIWRDILDANRSEVDKSITMLMDELNRYRDLVRQQPGDLEKEFQSSRALRSKIPKNMKGFMRPLSDIFVFMNDKPGQLARIANLLGDSGINIKDIELVKAREGIGGTFRLSFIDETEKELAKRVLEKGGFEVSI